MPSSGHRPCYSVIKYERPPYWSLNLSSCLHGGAFGGRERKPEKAFSLCVSRGKRRKSTKPLHYATALETRVKAPFSLCGEGGLVCFSSPAPEEEEEDHREETLLVLPSSSPCPPLSPQKEGGGRGGSRK